MAEHNLEGSAWGRSFAPRRDIVLAASGLVAAAHPFATQAGLEVLKRGGNAIDAAIACAAVGNVVLPSACGLGGDVFVIYHRAKTGEFIGLNGSGIVPQAATVDYYRGLGYRKMPLDGLLAASVPGQVDAYATLLEKYGTRSLEELLAPAIRYAEEGFPVSVRLAASIAGSQGKLGKFPTTARIFLPGGRPPRPGDKLVQKALAESLRKVAKGGRSVFYEGELAEQMAEFSQANGGLFSRDDFAAHKSALYCPHSVDYRGYTAYETMPPSQGTIVLEELNLLSGFDMASLGFNTAESIHLMVEAKKLAFADRLKYLGDPAFISNPIEGLLSAEYAAERRKAIDMERAQERVQGGALLPERRGDTTSFVVVDRDGDACSFIHSLSGGFGCGVVLGDTGILFNNRAGRGFTLEEGHPNQLAGGKKTMHTLNTYLLAKGGLPWMVGNTPGGDNQPQWNMQVIVNLIDYGMNIQQAIEAPRWTSFPGTDPATIEASFELRAEERVPEGVREQLSAKGHRVVVLPPWGGGAAQGIVIDRERGLLIGGSDPRQEGVALGY